MRKGDMETFKFTVRLKEDEITIKQANALFELGCSDGTAGVASGQAFIAFDRQAETEREAVDSALRSVRAAGLTPIGVNIVRVL